MKQKTIIGQCPICDRDMISGDSVNKHHFVPKCRGGKKTEYIHRVCHNKIHKNWPNEKELERDYNDPQKIREDPEMQKFIKWIKKKDPEFYDRSEKNKTTNTRI